MFLSTTLHTQLLQSRNHRYLNCIADSLSPNAEAFGIRAIGKAGKYLGQLFKKRCTRVKIEFVRMEKEVSGRYDGIIAFGMFTEEELERLRLRYGCAVYIGGLYEEREVRIGYRRLKCVKETFAQYGCLDEKNYEIDRRIRMDAEVIGA